MFPTNTRQGRMSNSHRISTNGKNSLTFESVVCSQLELKRRAASFSRRRSTMCRRTSTNFPIKSMNIIRKSSPMPPLHSTTSDISSQFIKMKKTDNDIKRSRTSSTNSINTIGIKTNSDRQSVISMIYWDGSSSRNTMIKKDNPRTSKWSIDFQKEKPHYGSLTARLIEEYTDCESLLEFAKKTILVLMKTKAATISLGIILIFPIIMMSIGVSHLNDCPHQTNLPIYLFVAGIVWITKLLQNIWQKYRLRQKFRNDEEPSSDHNDGHLFIDILMTFFLIIWFILGHYWLATIGYPPQFEQPLEAPDKWCHKTVVLCALASILITYFIVITFISLVIFLVFFTRYTILKRASTN